MTKNRKLIRNHKDRIVDLVINSQDVDLSETKIKVKGYSGNSVDLSDYGFDAPVVYNIAKMKTRQSIPMMYEHYQPIGHTTSVSKVNNNSEIHTEGVPSFPGEARNTVMEAAKNKYPFQASMGLKVDFNSIDYLSEGKTVVVNNRTFNGPIYVVNRSTLKEMTVTTFGRDEDTETVVNEEELQMIKNAEPTPPKDGPTPAAPAPETPAAPETPVANAPAASTPTPAPAAPAPVAPVAPQAPEQTLSVTDVLGAMVLQNKHPEHADFILSEVQAGKSINEITNSIALRRLEQQPRLPAIHSNSDDKNGPEVYLNARVQHSFGVNNASLQRQFGERVADWASDQPVISLRELVVNCANLSGKHFSGHTDIDECIKFVTHNNRQALYNNAYSTFDMPNLFEVTARVLMDQRWEDQGPAMLPYLKEESQSTFHDVTRVRPEGGAMWEKLSDEEKIKHMEFGTDSSYKTGLDTIARMLVLTRKTIINDEFGVIQDLMDLMVHGAMMVPDYQFGKLFVDDTSSWFTDNVNQIPAASATFGDTSLELGYNMVKTRSTNKGKVDWINTVSDKWAVIHGPSLERLVWETLNQDVLIGPTGSRQGQRNYWKSKFEQIEFPNMGNVSMFANAHDGMWGLLPKDPRFAPYTITFLNGRKKPTIEVVDMPGDTLGFAIRGYWDLNVNKRVNTTVLRAIPT